MSEIKMPKGILMFCPMCNTPRVELINELAQKEIDRLTEAIAKSQSELAEAQRKRDEAMAWNDVEIEKRKQAERERDMLLAAVEASENEKKQYRRESDRYREALGSIANPYNHKWYKSANDGDDVVDRMIDIAREALKEL